MADHTKKVPGALNTRLHLPSYRIVESARLAQTSPQTLSRWFKGTRPVLEGKRKRVALSYLQLVEAAFVASFRSLGVPLQRVRTARDYLAQMFEADYPFAQLELQTDGLDIFKQVSADREELFIAASRSGQQTWPELISDRIAQFDYVHGLALRWHPRGRNVPIVVDPQIAFGAPTLENAGIATWALAERFKAGEEPEEIQEDFGISGDSLVAALDFEEVLRAA